MDGSQSPQQMTREEVEAQVQVIKAHMPQTYRSIQARAQSHGRSAYAQVRAAIAGQPDQFYAIEGGRVMGTPFTAEDIKADLALAMVQFGPRSVVVWPATPAAGAADAQR